MKEHFSLGSLIFYSCAIGSVVVLFTLTTAYGERNLQAPRRIDGRYPLAMQVPTDCLKGQPVNLLLQQSGVFLTGALLPENASERSQQIALERPSLSGRWGNDQLVLEGNLGREWNCNANVTIAGQISENTLQGTLSLSTIPSAIPVSGDRQPPPPQPESH
ncbi:MAG: hypothetical protein NW220_01705 [Leptolyngbyaceae cyanobacterium bins.349]|nr:hypothetical protein [Leptolyngbyaceae cyanobacterium bins.349]